MEVEHVEPQASVKVKVVVPRGVSPTSTLDTATFDGQFVGVEPAWSLVQRRPRSDRTSARGVRLAH